MMRNSSVIRLMCLLLLCQGVWADHLAPSKIAEGKPEHMLAGVNVYNSRIESVIKRLGKPDKITSTEDRDGPPGSGERAYEWDRYRVRMRVATEFRTDTVSKRIIETPAMIVDVWGVQRGKFGSTGKGLSLGANIEEIRRIYGPRFQKDAHSVIVQWKDETTLVIDLNHKGHIVHMQLLAATE